VDIGSHYNSILDWIAGNCFLLVQPVRDAITGNISESAEIALVG
jgi:hypothetical protein